MTDKIDMSYYWNERTWSELKDAPPRVVLLPVGSTEAHGPHLPLNTDAIISDELARRAALTLTDQHSISTLILPPFNYVITDFSKDFPGTISISKQSFQMIFRDVAKAVHDHGVKTLCIVNSHLEPDHIAALHEFASNCKEPNVLFPDKTRKPWASLLTEEFKSGACHAGSYETSLVLASKPDLVRELRTMLPPKKINLAKLMKNGVRNFRDAGAADAYFGDPATASKQEGEQIYEILTRMIVETILHNAK